MKDLPLSVIILAKNASETITKTLESVDFAKEIVVLNDGSVDDTVAIAQQHHAFVHAVSGDFAKKRTEALKYVTHPWIFYIDADEVVTQELERDITSIVSTALPGAFSVKRRNIFLGSEMYPDRVDRLFHRSVITGWSGKVHESPILTCSVQTLQSSLLHYTHRTITSMLEKTNEWSIIEAQLRFDAHHPPMAWWRFFRVGITFFTANFFEKKLYRYGVAGLFESYFQMLDKLIVYTKLWELQHQPS